MWNAVPYFENISNKLKLTAGKYHFCRVTGLGYLEDVLANMKTKNAFFAVDDSDDGMTIRKGGAYFNRRSVVVYILKKYNFLRQDEREAVLQETRAIREKITSRLIKDSNEVEEMYYLNKDRIPYHEVSGYFAAGTAGVYFIVTIEEPVNLCYDASDWN